jgi:hypothetical protein
MLLESRGECMGESKALRKHWKTTTIMPKTGRRWQRIRMGGKAGFLHSMIPINNNSNILGAGSFGLVVSNTSDNAMKLFYDLNDLQTVRKEAQIQEAASKLLEGIVKVPRVHETLSYTTTFRDNRYLCGIIMDRVPFVNTFSSALHILLGYKHDDIDVEWSRDNVNPPSEDNPTRGFHASPEMMEAIWQDEGRTDISIDSVSYTMGKAMATLLRGGIQPYDLEWIYGGDGEIYLIDFGMCKVGHKDPMEYLEHVGSWGLGSDYYIPHKEDRGYEAFMLGFGDGL